MVYDGAWCMVDGFLLLLYRIPYTGLKIKCTNTQFDVCAYKRMHSGRLSVSLTSCCCYCQQVIAFQSQLFLGVGTQPLVQFIKIFI